MSQTEEKKMDARYTDVVQSSAFKKLLKSKKTFIIPMTIFFFLFYFSLPLMTSYTTVLNQKAFGPVTWAWVFAFAQFVMTWTLCYLYSKRANSFDEKTKQILSSIQEEKP
ncbi:DUF485 domain-containing protein [Mycobacteroides abscessus]|uniref:DUF485 domain-containing protein n=1 Tax=Mycobacteroides abscessus TaxID=36809 RepID=UPI000C267D34